eukprot:snap_masked-scaffold_18-processed-gene-6.41-mRNA-1 protein AED:1.00 eAED:1.00 QI:0/-1/0/0/-1/1/1/0/354
MVKTQIKEQGYYVQLVILRITKVFSISIGGGNSKKNKEFKDTFKFPTPYYVPIYLNKEENSSRESLQNKINKIIKSGDIETINLNFTRCFFDAMLKDAFLLCQSIPLGIKLNLNVDKCNTSTCKLAKNSLTNILFFVKRFKNSKLDFYSKLSIDTGKQLNSMLTLILEQPQICSSISYCEKINISHYEDLKQKITSCDILKKLLTNTRNKEKVLIKQPIDVGFTMAGRYFFKLLPNIKYSFVKLELSAMGPDHICLKLIVEYLLNMIQVEPGTIDSLVISPGRNTRYVFGGFKYYLENSNSLKNIQVNFRNSIQSPKYSTLFHWFLISDCQSSLNNIQVNKENVVKIKEASLKQ